MDCISEDMDRFSIAQLLDGADNVGIELGVAAGGYSARLVQSGKFAKLFGVDMYADHHDQKEYCEALKVIGLEANYSLLKMTFDEALELFPDDYFDFIYIDGYAHTGEVGGKTFFDWLPKLKDGGILAGDDYCEKWPLVQKAVHHFVEQVGAELHVTSAHPESEEGSVYDDSPSWFIKARDLSNDWKRDAAMEEQGKALAQKTADLHGNFLQLGRAFAALIHDSKEKNQPSFFDHDGKRVFVVVK